MNGKEAIEYIHSVSWLGSRPGLSRITELCSLLGNPQDSLRFIHVAGTNGKGSVCAMLSSVLREHGLKTGEFTSPYIYSFNERISIGAAPISDGELASVVEKVKACADTMADPPTEFELICAAGFLWFKEQKCDVVILEVGMGGRLDSTNIIKSPILSVITGIDLDHTAFLGDTYEKIAAEKAGIIKSGCPVLIGKCNSTYPATNGGLNASEQIIKDTADSLSSPFFKTDYGKLKNVCLSENGAHFTVSPYGEPFEISLAGCYQPENAALVIKACEILGIDEKSVRNGLKKVKWRGRFEKLSQSPAVFFDGGHNPQGVAAAVSTVKSIFGEKISVVTGVMADKAYRQMAETIAQIAGCVFCVTPDNPRALAADALAEVYGSLGVEAHPFSSVEEALHAAVAGGKPVLGLGSLYMYKEFYDALCKQKLL